MGLTVVLRDERGKAIRSVGDPTNVLHGVLPHHDDDSCQLLRFVDWYGDTVFNRGQVEDVLTELDRLTERASDEEARALILRVRELAVECQRGVHLYLVFVGD